MNKSFKVVTSFVFTGEFDVKAKNRADAVSLVTACCGMVSNGVHSNLNEETVTWHFPVHPDMKIHRVIKLKEIGPKIKPKIKK